MTQNPSGTMLKDFYLLTLEFRERAFKDEI
mgnify:CR=1 FL=1|jgi:hypothetical protein